MNKKRKSKISNACIKIDNCFINTLYEYLKLNNCSILIETNAKLTYFTPFSTKCTHGSFPNTTRVVGDRKSSFLITPSKAIRFIDDPNDRATVVQN
jgi:hypothetical protein